MLMDPIEIGKKMPFAIMQAAKDAGMDGEDLVTFGIMMDIALGTQKLLGATEGLELSPSEFRSSIAVKVGRLGLAVKK